MSISSRSYTVVDLRNDIDRIVQQIEASNVKYDYIVPVIRGGLIPGVMLSHKLGINCLPVGLQTRDFTNKVTLEFGAYGSIIRDSINNLSKRILLVDDIIDSGETVTRIIKRDFAVKQNVDICGLIYNTAQSFVPNFYGRTIDRNVDNSWIKFWWEC